MNIELKNYKPAHNLSQETLAFTASMYIDGKRVAHVQNDGSGGPNEYDFTDRKLEQKFYDYCKSLPPVPVPENAPDWQVKLGPMPMDADLLVGELCERIESQRWMKKQTKKAVLFRVAGDAEGQYRTIPTARKPADYRARAVEHVKQKYGDQLLEVH